MNTIEGAIWQGEVAAVGKTSFLVAVSYPHHVGGHYVAYSYVAERDVAYFVLREATEAEFRAAYDSPPHVYPEFIGPWFFYEVSVD